MDEWKPHGGFVEDVIGFDDKDAETGTSQLTIFLRKLHERGYHTLVITQNLQTWNEMPKKRSSIRFIEAYAHTRGRLRGTRKPLVL